jgi:hypothetical protein
VWRIEGRRRSFLGAKSTASGIVSKRKTALHPWLAKRIERGYYSNNILKTRNQTSP